MELHATCINLATLIRHRNSLKQRQGEAKAVQDIRKHLRALPIATLYFASRDTSIDGQPYQR